MELALLQDCHKLIANFVKKRNTSFQAFCHEWKALQFQYIFAEQTTTIELLQTTIAVLNFAKRAICPLDTNVDESARNQTVQILNRIGGLYLLYALYLKQPAQQYVKIEVALETWKQMRKFIKLLPTTSEYTEPRYVFWKLVDLKAFRFTALDFHVGIENLIDYDTLEDQNSTNELLGQKSLKQDMDELYQMKEKLPESIELEQKYNAIKSKQYKNYLSKTNIFSDIANTFENIQSVMEERTIERERPVNIRNDLKRKAAHKMNTITTKEELPSVAKCMKYLSMRRMSARNSFAEKLPDEFSWNLEENDTDNNNEDDDEDSIEIEEEEDDDEPGPSTSKTLKRKFDLNQILNLDLDDHDSD